MQGGFPGPQSYTSAEEAADVEDEVRRRVKKIERREEKQMRQEARARGAENKREWIRKEAATSVYGLLVLSFLTLVLSIIPIFGKSWALKGWTGFGVRVLWIHMGLLYMEVQVDCSSHKIIADRLCQVARKVTGKYAVHEGVNVACAVSNRACELMNSFYLASFLVFASLILAVVFQLLGSALLYNYWYNEPLPRVRRLGVFLLVGSPMVGCFGLASWALLAPDIASLPNSWTAASASISGTTLFGYTPMPYQYYGWCFFMALATYIMQGGYIAVTFLMAFSKHPLEEEARDNERLQKEMLETEVHTFDVGGVPYDLGQGYAASPALVGYAANPAMLGAPLDASFWPPSASSGGLGAMPQPRNAPW